MTKILPKQNIRPRYCQTAQPEDLIHVIADCCKALEAEHQYSTLDYSVTLTQCTINNTLHLC